MRLVCPNCDAEYEVDASAIPETGRDVQCSACGHAWFQLPPEIEEELATEEALFTAPPAAEAPPGRRPEAEPEAEDPDDTPPPPLPEAAPARSLDDSVLAVLREEAEREAAARRAEGGPALETQAELGLSDPAPALPGPVARRVARLKGIEPPAAPEPPPAPAKPANRRELLPEIEEINSTLRATTEPREGEAAAVAEGLTKPRRSGFANGFVLAVLLAAVGLALYIMAPRLSQQIPGLSGALTAYVAAVDAGRLWLDGAMQKATGALHGLTGG